MKGLNLWPKPLLRCLLRLLDKPRGVPFARSFWSRRGVSLVKVLAIWACNTKTRGHTARGTTNNQGHYKQMRLLQAQSVGYIKQLHHDISPDASELKISEITAPTGSRIQQSQKRLEPGALSRTDLKSNFEESKRSILK